MAAPFVCPAKVVSAGSSQEQQIASVIPSGHALDAVAKPNVAAAALRSQGISSGIIIDNLSSAYCPGVAANASLNDQQKTTQARRFSAKIIRVVYGLDSGDDIILDVPFQPDVIDVINSKESAERLAPAPRGAKGRLEERPACLGAPASAEIRSERLRGAGRIGARYLISRIASRKRGCSAVSIHSKTTVSVVTISAPCRSMRRMAVSLSSACREPSASRTT